MTASPTSGGDQRRGAGAGGVVRGLWQRQLPHYPETTRRFLLLGIVVLATVLLYYQYYIGAAVVPSILREYDISFQYYVSILVVGNALGAFGSLAAGLADRWGRANLVAYGLLAVSILTLVGVPNAHSGLSYAVLYAAVAVVEGVVLVATPALVRDFSPQLGRASAMGFWALGPVLGSLIVSEVSSNTLSHLPNWQDQYRIAGYVGLAVWLIAFAGLRELSPQLRDQLMVSSRDRALIEARAATVDVEQAVRRPWQQVLHPGIVAGAVAISLFLLIYYTAVAFMVVYFTTVFGFSQDDANGILNWWWGVEAVTLIVIGVASDRLGVRKPFMAVGGAGTLVMTVVLVAITSHTGTGRTSLIVISSLLGFFISFAFAPWMAAFTETVEERNPALTATGLAVWGWILRAVVAGSFLCLPLAVHSITNLVDYGPRVQAAAARYAPELEIIQAHPTLFAQLSRYTPSTIPPELLQQAVTELGGGTQGLQQLLAVAGIPPDTLAFLQAHGADVQAAQAAAPGEWQRWLWVCVGGEVVFLPLIPLLSGRWSPAQARRDEAEHERARRQEMESLGLSPT